MQSDQADQVENQAPAHMKNGYLILISLFLLGVILQHAMGGDIDGVGGRRIPFVVFGLSVFMAVLCCGLRARWFRILASNRFAVPAIMLLTILSIMGTLILQSQPANVIETKYGSAAHLIRGLFLDDLFHSLGFVAVLCAGAAGLALTLCRRRKPTLRSVGAMGAHAGLLLVLVGAGIGNVWVVKGRLSMHVGQRKDAFVVDNSQKQTMQYSLPFEVGLDDFKLEFYEPEYSLAVYANQNDSRPLLKVDPGKQANSKLARFGVEITDYWPDHTRQIVVKPVEAEKPALPDKPAALGLVMQEDQPRESSAIRWLFASSQEAINNTLVVGASRLAFFWDEAKAMAFANDQSQPISAHRLRVAGTERGVEVGQLIELSDSPYNLKVIRTFTDFVIDDRTKKPANRSDLPNNPALEVALVDKTGQEQKRTFLFEKFPDFHGSQAEVALAKLRYRYLSGQNQSVRYVLVGQTQTMYEIVDGLLKSPMQFAPGKSLTFDQNTVRVAHLHKNVERSAKNITRSSRPDNPVVRLNRLGTALGTDLVPRRPIKIKSGEIMALVPKRGDPVKDYLSTMSIWEDGKKVRSKVVEVNYPLEHKGFVFYQADYRPDDATFSGFQVVRDSGLWLVYLGFAINLGGVMLALFVPAFIKRRKRSASGGAQ